MAALNSTIVVHYDGTDVGRIYLGDVGQRTGLGGGRGLYSHGQDRYISKGQDATFATSGDVLMDIQQKTGRIGHYVSTGSFHITY